MDPLTVLVDNANGRKPLPRCEACGSEHWRCTLCDLPARHFITFAAGDLHLCDSCAAPYQYVLDEGKEGYHEAGYPELPFDEIAAYCPNTECAVCDPWGWGAALRKAGRAEGSGIDPRYN